MKMMLIKKLVVVALVASFGLGMNAGTWSPKVSAAEATTLKQGTQNGDVWDAQFRLKTLGIYEPSIDGKYGPITAAAVRNFQTNYGLSVDGIVGAKTWEYLRKFTVNQAELDMLAKVIYSEARGESYEGQVAVGAVVMNRLKSSQFENTIQGIVFEVGAFTAVSDGQYNLTPDSQAYKAALEAVRGWDPTGGALYYFNPKTATSAWIWTRQQTVQIGNHIFAK
ncbi:spore cortex-lytic enzyme [Paenibacillus sp. LjRoot56]|uniref:spore cortex-lytic enzyme n=1 Tax=Paenibacillus sp. LjRoot56 TaxID=3342333 RepID=UPI003ECF9750